MENQKVEHHKIDDSEKVVKKEPVLKKKKNVANIDKKLELKTGEENYVIFDLEFRNAPKNPDSKENFNAPIQKRMQHPERFVNAFAVNFKQNGWFENVSTPALIYRIMKNITTDIVELVASEQISSVGAVGNKKLQEAKKIKQILSDLKKVGVSGGNMYINADSFKHIPELDPKLINVFPKECINPELVEFLKD